MTAAAWPPRPHDPREREVVGRAGAWEVRQFAAGDAKLAYFTVRGFLHLQLWHPQAQISILTPSRLTAGHFEAWLADTRIAVRRWVDLDAALGGRAPAQAELRALERWFVLRHEPAELHLLRLWWAATAPRAHHA